MAGIFPFGDELDTSVRPTSGRGRLPLLAAALTGKAQAARGSKSGDSRVNELFIAEGDRVEAGQLIATLQGLDQKQAELAAEGNWDLLEKLQEELNGGKK